MLEAIRLQLARTVPFARFLGISVDGLDRGTAVTTLPPLPQHNNLVGSVHAGVLFTLCESAAGAALAGALLPAIMQTRFIVRDVRIHFVKPVRGSLTARAALVEEAVQLLETLRASHRALARVDVTAHAADGSLVAKASFDWSLRLQTSE